MRPILTGELQLIKNFGADLLTGGSSTGITLRFFHTATHVGGDDTDFDVSWSEGPFDCTISVRGFAEVQQIGAVGGSTYVTVQQAIIKFPWKYFDSTDVYSFTIKNAPTTIHHFGVMGQHFSLNISQAGSGSLQQGINQVGGIGDWEVISAGKGVSDGVEYLVNNTETIGGAGYRTARSGSMPVNSQAARMLNSNLR